MSEEAKRFVFGLEQCRHAKGMKWHGSLPKEIQELYDVKQEEVQHGYMITGIYVVLMPAYEAFTPEWMEQ